MANNLHLIAHNYPSPDVKRYNIGSELENWSMGELFIIDDLLDFSNEDIAGPIGESCHPTGSSAAATENLSSNTSADRRNFQVPSVLDADAGPGELCVPCDDLAELEWLSNFAEESFSSGDGFPHSFGTVVNTIHHSELNGLQLGKEQFQSASPVSVLESSSCSGKFGSFSPEMAVPGRARSKRSRSGVCFWNTRIFSADSLASFLESSSTSTVTATAPLSPDSDAFFTEQSGADSLPAKKTCENNRNKTKKVQDAVQTRKCLHCGIQRTPQWRTGPLGPKTLCNACGVRYKSGRLLPEYRPAASPTFVEAIHSNSHKKVLEMRRQRDAEFRMNDIKKSQQMFETKCGDAMCVLNQRDESAKDM